MCCSERVAGCNLLCFRNTCRPSARSFPACSLAGHIEGGDFTSRFPFNCDYLLTGGENSSTLIMEQCADDLPLMANTSHILVKHYALDFDVCFETRVITGNIVLFLEPVGVCEKDSEDTCTLRSSDSYATGEPSSTLSDVTLFTTCSSNPGGKDCAINVTGERDTSAKYDYHGNLKPAPGISLFENHRDTGNDGNGDFVLVLDCCDLSVLKVEELDVAAVPVAGKFIGSAKPQEASEEQISLLSELTVLPASQWKDQLWYYTLCSRTPGCGELMYTLDAWSLRIRKAGIKVPADFPSVIRIWYKTTADGRSVKWTKDQSGRPCVYTIGASINNRALFPCQEPPVAMSTWQATVRAATAFVVLMSGENAAVPKVCDEGFYQWFYYVTMPMPASTFTIAVGSWEEVKEITTIGKNTDWSPLSMDYTRSPMEHCKHMDYPCRFRIPEAQTQPLIPHRIFAPLQLMSRCTQILLPLVPLCLEAAYTVLGTHPFSRLDILIVPYNFSSLGMASPHIIYLSQSILSGRNHLCMTRVCHEIAHAWFGLAIGARDWTEEWISEGFATHLEDTFLRHVKKLSMDEATDLLELRALLRLRRLSDEVKNSEEDLQILRPHGEHTGEVSESGASIVRHGLNAEKTFMQVHYLKGYFLLRFFENKIGHETYILFLKNFVNAFHGQLILSEDFFRMMFECVPEENVHDLSVESINQIWLDSPGIPRPLLEESQAWKRNRLVQQVNQEVSKWIRLDQQSKRGTKRKRQGSSQEFDEQILPDQLILLLELLLEEKTLCPKTLHRIKKTYGLQDQDSEVRHRWCELAVKHRFTAAYKDVETFLHKDQAMGVYLYGELMVNEDARQQELAHRCFAAVRDEMDVSCVKVVGEMLF